MQAVFDHSEQEADDIVTFWFKPEKPMRYTAGQFTELRLPHDNVDERGDKRWFTLSSSPTDQMVSITTKLPVRHTSSFKQQLKSLQPGTIVNLAEPMGDFVLPQQTSIPLVFVAGGIGVTPMHSMIKWLVTSGEKRTIYLLYGASRPEELAFQDLFLTAPITYVPMISAPDGTWQGKVGKISSDLIFGLPGVTQNALIYISGPEPMVEQCAEGLSAHGIPPHRVIGDYFPGYPAQ